MKYLIPLSVIASITTLELVALSKGFNGTLLKLAFASIGAVLGYSLKMFKKG